MHGLTPHAGRVPFGTVELDLHGRVQHQVVLQLLTEEKKEFARLIIRLELEGTSLPDIEDYTGITSAMAWAVSQDTGTSGKNTKAA